MTQYFLYGFGASLGFELVALGLQYNVANSWKKLPHRYKEWKFWIIRLGIAVVSGFLVEAYEVNDKIVAIQLGITAPSVLMGFSKENFTPPNSD